VHRGEDSERAIIGVEGFDSEFAARQQVPDTTLAVSDRILRRDLRAARRALSRILRLGSPTVSRGGKACAVSVRHSPDAFVLLPTSTRGLGRMERFDFDLFIETVAESARSGHPSVADLGPWQCADAQQVKCFAIVRLTLVSEKVRCGGDSFRPPDGAIERIERRASFVRNGDIEFSHG
jgi:hypothetical protein